VPNGDFHRADDDFSEANDRFSRANDLRTSEKGRGSTGKASMFAFFAALIAS